MNEFEKAISLYEHNRSVLARALEAKGGDSALILARKEWRSVMTTIAANGIWLQAETSPPAEAT